MKTRDPSLWMWAEAVRLLDEADRLRQQFFQVAHTSGAGAWEPPVDIFETDEGWWVMVALPGVPPDDVRYALDGDELQVAAVRRVPAECMAGAIRRLEIPHGRFQRTVRFPTAPLRVAAARMRDGCLVLALDKLNR